MEQLTADVLVVGGGAAGLMAATRAQEAGAKVVLLGGSPSNSSHISGLSTALSYAPQDEPAAFFNDLFVGGKFVNQPSLVATMAHRIGPEILFLDALGVPFQRSEGRLARRQGAGSSWTRATFTTGLVGFEICRLLLERLRAAVDPPALCLDGAFLTDLALDQGAVCGGLANVPSRDQWLQIHAPAVVLAMGGIGRLFGRTYNPMPSFGFGHALALEAGARLVDMEFVCYEPFVLLAPPELGRQGLPTTLLQEGARLRNSLGEEFLDTRTVLTKDVISLAMLKEVQAGRGTPSGGIQYDLREMPAGATDRYAKLSRILRTLGLTPSEAMLEVAPAQQSVNGGIRIDSDTSTDVEGLFAAGEVAGGVHGAHRLATCGGTDAVAFGAVAGERAAKYARTSPALRHMPGSAPQPELLDSNLSPRDRERLQRVGAALDEGCGMLRDAHGLRRARMQLRGVRDELVAEGRLKSFIGRASLVALSIAESALARTESRGDHYRVDHPRRDDLNWLGNLTVRMDEGQSDLALAYQQAGISGRAAVPLPG